uniref:Cytochrome P450 n=1 Tax=Picea sitchensis TaxID=3332 RepID=B8LLC1_PICSI|nr:unknown [Picea sitchensis]
MDFFSIMQRMRIIEFASGSSAALLGTAACICCVLLFFISWRRRRVPIQWPIIGMVPSLFIHLILNDTYDWLSRTLNKCGGTFVFRGPNKNWSAVITSDPANVEYILKTKFSSFPKGPTFTRAFRDFLGDGILNADGHFWASQRKTAVSEFNSSTSLGHAIESLQESVRGRLIPILADACSSCRIIDLQDVFMRFTFDNICNRAFGVEPCCLSPSLPSVPFAKAIEVAAEATALRFVTPKFVRRFMRRLGVGIDVKLQSALKIIDEFVMEIVSSRRKQFISAGSDYKLPEDLLSVFMKSRDEHGFLYSETLLRDVCVNFILAGRDTTSVALSWFFWLLLQHPSVEDKIMEEIYSILEARPNQKQEGNDPVCFSKDELKQMHYLHACLSEAIRLYPPLPLDRKQVSENVVLPDGTPIKKGTVIFYIIYAMGRMESIWGNDCMEFKPERWLNKGVFLSHPAPKFAVFNGGPRLCLGKDFAYLQMKYLAASVLYCFKVRAADSIESVESKLGVTLYMKGGFRVTLHARPINT